MAGAAQRPLLAAAGLAAAAGEAPVLALPEVPLEGLLRADPGAVEEARRALSELGLLAVVGVDDGEGGEPLDAAADAALRGWAGCLSAGGAARGKALVRPLAGGRVRRVSATAGGGWGDAPAQFGPPCGAAAAPTRSMRRGLRRATRALAAALELRGSSAGPAAADDGVQEGTAAGLALSRAVERGSHLEHLHLYEEAAGADAPLDEAALDLHIDAGLLLAFVSPLMAAGSSAGAAGALEVEIPDGQRRAVAAPRGGVVFLAGEASGLLRWPGDAAAWRPVPHALRLRAGFAWRAWFGAMLLPPPDTLVRGSPGSGSAEASATEVDFDTLWEHKRLELAAQVLTDGPRMASDAVGCSGGWRLADQAGACPSGTISCWKSCMPVAGLEHCTGQIWVRKPGAPGSLARLGRTNLSVQCREQGSGKRWPSETGDTCPDCQPMCTVGEAGLAPAPAPEAAAGDMCRRSSGSKGTGSGTTMYMDGLRWTSAASDEVCVAFLAPTLVVDTRWKLALACLGGAVLSLGVQATAFVLQRLPAKRQWDAGLFFQVVSLLFVYSSMLLVMTYSLELFGSVVLGLSLSHAAGNRLRRGRVNVADATDRVRSVVVAEGMGMSLGPMGLSLALQSVELQTHLTVTLVVEGMTGPDCVEKVTKALIAIEGVVCVDVSLDLEEVDVVYQPFVLRRDLRDAVRRAGYTAGVQMNGAMSHTHTDPSSTRRSPSLSNVRSPDRDSLQPLGFGTMPGAAATDRSISDPTASRGSSLN